MSFPRIVLYVVLALGIPLLASIINCLIGGRLRSAWMTLRVYLIILAIYGTVLVATTLALPVQMLPAGETLYAGDWSISLLSLRRIPHGLDEDYEVDLRMGNRGTKPVGGYKNMIVYLLSENGTRYDATPEPSTPPFDTPVKPGKFVTTTRKFVLPTNLNRIEMVIERQGLRIDKFVIGRTPFDGRSVIVIQQ